MPVDTYRATKATVAVIDPGDNSESADVIEDDAYVSGVSSAVGDTGSESGRYSTFSADELKVVLSHFNVGRVESVHEFPRGSKKSPKAIVRCEKGLFLLKRRARGKDNPVKVAFCHELQLYLAFRQFPLPHLVGVGEDGCSMLQYRGRIYEMFEYIRGSTYDSTIEATIDSGKILSLFHKLLRDYQPVNRAPRGSYHAAESVSVSMEAIPSKLARSDPEWVREQSELVYQAIRFLKTSYAYAATRVNETGLTDWPMQIIHSDWHPGNMLFYDAKVVAVIDYDSARIQHRIIDVANAALQFSILGGSDNPSHWPDYIERVRFREFVRGYDSVSDNILSQAELQVIPWLMIEALIAESAIPIAMTGSFARMDGIGFLLMVERKVRWLRQHAEELVRSLET